MSERLEHLSRIKDDLETYVTEYCPSSDDGKYNDFSGEKCGDALMLLQEAIDHLRSGT